jgi:iron complex outermembrane receptor protein
MHSSFVGSRGKAQSISLRHAIAAVLAFGAVTVISLPVRAQVTTSTASAKDKAKEDDTVNLSDVSVTDDPLRALATQPSASSFGFAKPLLETPRAVTFVSEEQLSKFGIQSVQDLTRLVPGTYTTTRYGLQGAINIRTVTADQYYRGMKRLDQQGHVRTVLSAYDNIEVIKGPPSPLYGMGRIGGYTVLDPKSSRARTGKYMTKEQGYFQALTGSYKLSEIQFGEGVPFTVAGRAAGVYVMGLLENSQGWIKNVGAQQRFLQVTGSVDNAVGPFRLETGGQIQNSVTSGSYMNRGTQALVDHGTYISGQPMVNMDLNGDGRIGTTETYLASAPKTIPGVSAANNQPLTQRFTWKSDASGNPIPLADFQNSINGIPQTFKNYLTAHPEVNCPLANYMRTTAPVATQWSASTSAAQTTQLINYPQGFFVNPCTVKTQQVDYRANGSFERQQNATQRMSYLDLVYDSDPNFTAKNQVFYDSIDSFKDSWLPYGERQYIKAIEDKITLTKTVPSEWLPSWMTANSLGSINYRDTRGFIRSSGGDFDYRQDVMYTTAAGSGAEGSGTGGMYPNTMFWNQLDNNSYATGAPATSESHSQYSEKGVGLMLDLTFLSKTNLVLGARRDYVNATVDTPPLYSQTANVPSTFDQTTANNMLAGYLASLQGLGATCSGIATGCPGGYLNPIHVSGSDKGTSWSASISHELPWGGMRPYFTAASSTLSLDGSNNLFSSGTVQGSAPLTGSSTLTNNTPVTQYGGGGKLVGDASLRELGIKGVFFGGKAQWTLDGFRQVRTDVSSPSDPTVAVEVTSTETKGLEGDIKVLPTKGLFISASAVYMTSKYLAMAPNTNMEVSGRDLGFQDIKYTDPSTGKTYTYPAEAFLYGGRTALQMTDPNGLYNDVPGLPNWQGALTATYDLSHGLGVNAGAQYFSKSWANRIKTVTIPQATLFDAGATYDHGNMHLRASMFNVADKRYFQSGQTTNANLLTVMPGRRWQLQLKADF